jgi:ABC-type uncharacterized transport system permease subunit
LTAGIALGLLSLVVEGGHFDRVMAATLLAWAVYAALLLTRHATGLRGRRSAYVGLAGFLLVLTILPITHFS